MDLAIIYDTSEAINENKKEIVFLQKHAYFFYKKDFLYKVAIPRCERKAHF